MKNSLLLDVPEKHDGCHVLHCLMFQYVVNINVDVASGTQNRKRLNNAV